VLALLASEPGADEVEASLEGAAMSTVNLSEVLQKSEQHGIDTEGLEFDLEALGVELLPLDVAQARVASDVWVRAPRAGLSLGDRACLALAESIGGIALTMDRRWSAARHGVRVRVLARQPLRPGHSSPSHGS
jgi:PIN domain nuclease of toxin-antitoxin system